MADYPKFSFDKNGLPYWPPELSKEFEEYAKRQLRCLVPHYDDLAPSMSFEKFKELMSKKRSAMVIDEPTRLRPKVLGSINPDSDHWFSKLAKEYLKDNG